MAVSSLVMVPSPTPSPIKVPPVGLLKVSVMVSSASTIASPETVTSIVFVVSPDAKLTVPEIAV